MTDVPATPVEAPPAPATLTRRLAALSYDALLLVAVLAIFTLLTVWIRGGRPVVPGTWWFELALGAIVVVFFGWFWTHGGQTLGMRAWRIRVVNVDGLPIGWPQAITRLLTAVVAAAPLGLGFWWSLFDTRRRCWHDRLSRTEVIRDPSGTR